MSHRGFPEDEKQRIFIKKRGQIKEVYYSEEPKSIREAQDIGLSSILKLMKENDVEEVILDGGMIQHQPLISGQRREVPFSINQKMMIDKDDYIKVIIPKLVEEDE
jgi:hypothetical protein